MAGQQVFQTRPVRSICAFMSPSTGGWKSATTSVSYLPGTATELLKTAVRESLEGVGVPPVRELLIKAAAQPPIYV